MIKSAGIDFVNLPDEEADNPLGIYTGAGTIFGATGGVMEAAVRTAHYLITGSELQGIDLEAVRGLDGVREATVNIGGKAIRVAVAHSMSNISIVLDRMRKARDEGRDLPYHFIEVMACRGGCIGGGGQPYGATDAIRKQRIAGIYKDDSQRVLRRSHENPAVKALYDDYLGKPLSEKAHELLHTNYVARPLYQR
jgi:NADH-quinone oxidoreductase subunit G